MYKPFNIIIIIMLKKTVHDILCIKMEINKLLERQDIPLDVKKQIKDYLVSYKRMEEAHQELELQMVKTFDSMVDPIHLVDTDLRIIFFNTAFKQWNKELGLEEDVLGKTVQEVFPFLPNSVIEEYHQVFKSRKTSTTEGSIHVRNFEIFTEMLKIPLFEKGKVTRIVTVIRNITEHKQAEKALMASEEKFRTILDRIEDGYYEVDLAGNFTFFNSTLSILSGYDENEILGMNYTQYADKMAATRIFEVFNKVYQTGKPVKTVDMKLIRKDGIRYDVEASVSLMHDSDGKAIGFRGIVRDISDRKEAEEALREAKEKYQMLIEKMEEGVLLEDAEGKISFVNPRATNMFGYTEEELLGKHWTYIITQEDLDKAQTESKKRPSGISTTYEVNIKTKDGVHIPIIVTATPIFSKAGNFDGVLCVFTDITEQKQVEESLREAKEKYQMLIEKMEEGVLLEDANGLISFLNPKLADMFGYMEEELLGKHWSYIAAAEDLDKFEIESAKRPSGISSTYEARALAKDGSVIPVIITATPIFSKKETFAGVLSVYVDITERKRAEEIIQRTKQQLQDMFDNTPAAVYAKDLEGRYFLVNKQWRERTGLLNQEIIGKNDSEIFPQYYFEIWSENEKQVLESGESTQFEEIGRTTGQVYLATKFLLRNPNGEVYALCNNSIDITERKHAEEALREAKEKYQMLVEKMEEGVILETAEGNISFVNPKMTKILGYKEEELLGKHWSFIVPKEFHVIGEIESMKRLKGVTSNYESCLLAKNGAHIPIIASATPIISATGEFQGVLVVTTDITERKQMEDALKQVKHEEELYHAMLSHFVNNDLQVIINNLEMMMLKFESGRVMDNTLANKIMDAASRSSKTIDNVNKIFEVLQFPFVHGETHNLLTTIDDVISKLQSVLSLSCNVIINRESLDKVILGDKYLKNIFYELILFNQSSKENHMDEGDPIVIEGFQNTSYFCVSIRDSLSQPISEDISSSLSEKITEDWEYQGHYIGIALASVIMQHYGGSLKILALDQKGNEFQLYFPLNLLQYSKDSSKTKNMKDPFLA